jgi:hypothetical protein
MRVTVFPPAIYAPLSQHGISDDALHLQSTWLGSLEALIGSSAMGVRYMRVQDALASLVLEAARDNWDGYGSAPVDRASLGFAKRVAQMLPVSLPEPEVTVDPDGEVSFDWECGKRQRLSFSVGPSGTFRYAGIVGGSETYGTEPWRDGIPEAIVGLLQKVASSGNGDRDRR